MNKWSDRVLSTAKDGTALSVYLITLSPGHRPSGAYRAPCRFGNGLISPHNFNERKKLKSRNYNHG